MKIKSYQNKARWIALLEGIILATVIIFLIQFFNLPESLAAEEQGKETTQPAPESPPAEEKGKEAVKTAGPAAAGVDFASMVEKMTRTKKLYSINTFDTLLDVKVIYKSRALRSVFVDDYAARLLFSPEEKAGLQAKEEQAVKESEEFLVAIFTTDPNWSDINKADPAWHLYLYNDQNRRVEPSYIHKTSISSADIWKFYPQITSWTKLFKVTFPKTLPSSNEPFIGPETKKIKMVFAGVLGRAEVEWDLK